MNQQDRILKLAQEKIQIVGTTTPENRPRVCSQCGAPLHGHTCEYCGTEY